MFKNSTALNVTRFLYCTDRNALRNVQMSCIPFHALQCVLDIWNYVVFMPNFVFSDDT